jgi:hypothetical protein
MRIKKLNLITQLLLLFVLSSVVGILSILVGIYSSYILQDSSKEIKDIEEHIILNEKILYKHEKFIGNLGRDITLNQKPDSVSSHKDCILGKWYYKFIETQEYQSLPSDIKSKFGNMEKSHKSIHDIAKEYKDKYTIFDRDMQVLALKRESEHLHWADKLLSQLIKNQTLTVGDNHKACNYGKWYYSLKDSDKFDKLDSVIKNTLLSIESPHKNLHISVSSIKDFQSKREHNRAKEYFFEHTQKDLDEVQKGLRTIVSRIDELKASNARIDNLVINEGPKHLSVVVDALESYNKYLNIQKDELLKSNDTLVNSVIILFVIIFIVSIVSTLYGIIVNGGAIKKSMEITDSIMNSSKEINISAVEVSKSAVNLSNMATRQSAVVEEVSASTDHAVNTLKESESNIDLAKSLSIDMRGITDSGYESIKELTHAMDNVNDSAREISNILKTIDEIAFQTNLLALNAAVEAARAGEHGLGFAVVAEEVRALAGKSAESAKETSQIIGKSIDDINRGNQISKEANDSYKEILDKITETSELIDHISVASKEQSNIVSELGHAIHDISEVTQTLASSSEELAASSEEMSSQSTEINEQINQLSKNS